MLRRQLCASFLIICHPLHYVLLIRAFGRPRIPISPLSKLNSSSIASSCQGSWISGLASLSQADPLPLAVPPLPLVIWSSAGNSFADINPMGEARPLPLLEDMSTYKSSYIFIFDIEPSTQTLTISRVRSDNGGEFRNHAIDTFCRERGIDTIPYHPEQKVDAYWMNRTSWKWYGVRCLNRDFLSPFRHSCMQQT